MLEARKGCGGHVASPPPSMAHWWLYVSSDACRGRAVQWTVGDQARWRRRGAVVCAVDDPCRPPHARRSFRPRSHGEFRLGRAVRRLREARSTSQLRSSRLGKARPLVHVPSLIRSDSVILRVPHNIHVIPVHSLVGQSCGGKRKTADGVGVRMHVHCRSNRF